ncbi:MAG TPA: glycosyltransferase family 4 protein [Pyrinomonadaceae bacterium]
MRILQISSARALGGGERHVADLANALAERGHEVYAALAPRSPLYEELSALPEKNLFTLRLRNALDVGSAMELARLVRKYRIEIVHAHMARDYPLAALAVERASNGAQLVITRHVLFPLHRFHRFALSRVARVIAVSEAVARAVDAQRLFPRHKISLVANGIDMKRFDATARESRREMFRRSAGIAVSRRLVGMLGEIKPLKGQEDFLRAAAIIARRFADVDFIIAGGDTSRTLQHRAHVERLIAQLDLGGRVHLTGWVKSPANLLSALDIFVSASYTESFGLAIAEAMASGTPVVATATEGAREIIEDDVTGFLVPVADAEALASAITRLLEDVEERTRISDRASHVARERFSLERMVDQTERIYREALGVDAS